MKGLWNRLFFFYFIFLIISCKKEKIEIPVIHRIEIPTGFPEIHFPSDNAFTTDRWLLGKKLFYEKRLSKHKKVSCGTCHKQEFSFSDNLITSKGDEDRMGTSNVPTLCNVAYHPYLTRSGGVPSLEMQILVPIQEHNEFNHNIVEICEELAQDNNYRMAAMKAYGREFDPFVLVRAISCFERSLISGNSSYDQYTYQKNSNALNSSELMGMQLFFSQRTQCSTCHSGFNFTNYAFENNGLYEIYKDSGRMKLTLQEKDRSLFKVPTLRNVELTGPYMHDGSFQNLEQVIEHYNMGGKSNSNKSNIIQPLNLSQIEKQNLVSFLKTLTDHEFIKNKAFQE